MECGLLNLICITASSARMLWGCLYVMLGLICIIVATAFVFFAALSFRDAFQGWACSVQIKHYNPGYDHWVIPPGPEFQGEVAETIGLWKIEVRHADANVWDVIAGWALLYAAIIAAAATVALCRWWFDSLMAIS